MTNFEKIKQLSIEELAKLLEDTVTIEETFCQEKYCPFYQIDFNCAKELKNYHEECTKSVIKWLSDDVE
jgi:hypothetical protein